MADNVPVTGGDGHIVHADEYTHADFGAGKSQVVKVTWGPPNTGNDTDTASGKPFPVQLRGSDGTDRSNALPVTLASTTITGTVAATQSGTWNVGTVTTVSAVTAISNALPAGTNNIGDVDVLTLPALPAGTNNIGDVDVLSVVPGTAATNLGKAIDSVGGATDTGIAALAIRDDALTTLTPVDGDYVPLRVNSTGALHVTGGGGGTEYTEDVAAAADPSGQMLIAVRRDTLSASEVSADGDNIALKATSRGQLHVSASFLEKAIDTATGATDNGVLALFTRDDALTTITPADGDNAQGRVNARGAQWVAIDPAESGGLIDTGTAGTASTEVVTVQGIASMTPVQVTEQPQTTGGLTIFRSLDLDETEEEIKASAGQVYGMWVTNLATATRFVKFYNATAANVTVGTTTPVITVAIPGNASDDVTGLFSSTHGIAFATAITAAATTGIADNDTGAPGANEVLINVFYK